MAFFRSWLQLTSRLIALTCFALVSGAAVAQQASEQASEQAVKAGFIYNFVKFTQWGPQRDSDTSPLVVCTTAEKPLNGQFTRLQGRPLGARTLEVRNSVGTNDWLGCDVLFIAEADAGRIDVILRVLGSSPVLTVGDFTGFTKAGGMIGLRMEDSRVKFDVNLGSAQRAGLQLNSQMLKLAGQVIK